MDDDSEEVWFEAEALAAASAVVLGQPGGQAPASSLLARAPSSEVLVDGLEAPGLCLAQLPAWPEAPVDGAGLGQRFARLLGELRPGDVVAWTGTGRGVGRTSLLAQLADGLALRGADHEGPPSPVVWIGDHDPRSIRARSLARHSGLSVSTFLDSGHARRLGGASGLASVVAAYERGGWSELDHRQRFVTAGEAQLGAKGGDPAWLEDLARWRTDVAGQLEVEQVWPVAIVDALESTVAPGAALDRAAQTLAELAARAGLIVLVSCNALDEPDLSRRFDRHVHARVRLTPIERGPGSSSRLRLELCHGRLGQRGQVELDWQAHSGRFVTVEGDDAQAC